MEPGKKENNLWQRYFKRRVAGQIATLITLLIAAIFVFMVITINVGRVSQKKTQLSNAADAASLQLNSQIGSYAHYLSRTYLKGKKKICKFSFAMLFKVIAAIVITIASWGTLSPVAAAIITAAMVVTTAASVTIEAIYWGRISRQFKKMSQKMQFTEGAILAALQRIVDSQNQVEDIYDDDEDGLKNDLVPGFVQWYNERLRLLDEKITRPEQRAIDGIKSSIQSFDDKAQAFLPFIQDPTGDFVLLLGELEGCGYSISFWDPGNPLPQQCEELYSPGQCAAFEDSCENANDPNDCAYCSPYEEYLANFYHDPVDTMDFDIADKHEFASGITAQTAEELSKTIDIWKHELYGDSANDCPGVKDGDYYSALGRWVNDLAAWEDELIRVKAQAEACMRSVNMCQTCDLLTGVCSYDETLSCCCKLKDGLTLPQRIDNAIARLDAFKNDAVQFQGEIAGFNSSVDTLEEENIAEGQTKNKALYSWQDIYIKEGKKEPFWHHVKVEVNTFKMPRIKTYIVDFMKCAKLKHAKQTVWVEIKRYDQGQEGYPFWKFRYHSLPTEPTSPGNPGNIADAYWLTARSHGRYSYKKEPPKVVKAE